MLDKVTGSCLDPELPGTSLQVEGGGGEGPGPLYSGKKSQLKPSRDGENMRGDREEPILDMMEEDQQPTSEKIATVTDQISSECDS